MAKSSVRGDGPLAPATSKLIELASSKARGAAAKSADRLSDVAVRAAEVLSDTAQKFELTPGVATSATDSAREVLADASEALARAVRPKKHHLWRWSLLAAGTGAAIWISPLGKLMRDKANEVLGNDDLEEDDSDFEPDQPKSVASVQTFMAHGQEEDEGEQP